MAFTQSDLDNIQAAMASGELTAKVNGREVTYRSMTELQLAENRIREALTPAALSGDGKRRGAFRVTFSTHRGF